MKFSEIAYERVDLEGWSARAVELTERLRYAASVEKAEQVIREDHELEGLTIQSMRTVAQIRHDIDTRDAFYEDEMTFYNRELPKYRHLGQAWTKALLVSPYRRELEEKYGGVTLRNAEISSRTFKPKLVEDLQKENELVPHKLSVDDDKRRAAWRAEGQWFRDNGKELDRIFDELVALRDRMGRKLGHDGYTRLGYDRMKRNCYTEKDVEQFRIAVQTYIVPLCKRINMDRAKRMGFAFPMSFADKDLAFRSGNPKPAGSTADILAAGTRFYSELSPETKEFWNLMMEREMMDVESKPGKAAGGYCTGIYAAKMPFIFTNFNGTAHDAKVITHEAGHAFALYLNMDRVMGMLPSMEACEVHSMAMEFFADNWAELFLGTMPTSPATPI